MRTRSAWRVAVSVVLGLSLSACTSAAKKGSDAIDAIGERGVAAYAEGRWRCETEENDGGYPRHLTTLVAIGSNGRFSYEVVQEGTGPQVGTWSVKGLRLRLLIPWDDEGRNGFYGWVHDADANPPTHVRGRGLDFGSEQELDVKVSVDRIRIVQHDVPGPGGPNYDWDVTCKRASSKPGPIPPTIPESPPD